MQLKNSTEHYGLVSKLLHWLIAILIIVLLGIGWWMVDLTYYDKWYTDALLWHKSLGVCVGLLVFLKLGWRSTTANPHAQSSLTSFETMASQLVHYFLLLAMLIIPVSGYFVSTSEGASIEVFNWFSFPAFIEINENTRDIAINIHYYIAYATLAVVMLHASAALKHHFIDKDNTLKRML